MVVDLADHGAAELLGDEIGPSQPSILSVRVVESHVVVDVDDSLLADHGALDRGCGGSRFGRCRRRGRPAGRIAAARPALGRLRGGPRARDRRVEHSHHDKIEPNDVDQGLSHDLVMTALGERPVSPDVTEADLQLLVVDPEHVGLLKELSTPSTSDFSKSCAHVTRR